MQARRATVEDLPQLAALWTLERLSADELEKRFTEFQVVEDSGEVIAAVALKIFSHHGQLHSESIGRADVADRCREMLWNRIQVIARNHSLDRVWTNLRAPFWRAAGFSVASPEQVTKFPESFGDKAHPWQILMLRAEEGAADAIEKQFAMLQALHTREREQFHSRVAVIKKIAIGLTAVVAVLVVTWAVLLFRYGPKFINRR
jgi:N-acetylglutamate synthase-like GNAT family acetyltransferase